MDLGQKAVALVALFFVCIDTAYAQIHEPAICQAYACQYPVQAQSHTNMPNCRITRARIIAVPLRQCSVGTRRPLSERRRGRFPWSRRYWSRWRCGRAWPAGRQGEDDVEILHRQQVRSAHGYPVPRRRPLTFGARPVLAGSIGDVPVATAGDRKKTRTA